MQMKQKLTLGWILGILVVFSSCVSSKKYKAATTEAQNAKAANDSLMRRNSELQSQLTDAVSSNKMLTEERNRYQKESDSAREQLKTYQTAVDEYMTNADEITKKVQDRLADYADRGASVEYKDGLVYVNLDDELLFRKGTNTVGKDGETVLGTLASTLNEYPNLKIVVVGHTDDRAGRGRDNWTVSTERANNVVRELKDMKIDPARLTSAGRAQYSPIGDNSTAEGRAQNRRTEIILTPEPFKLLNRQQ
jgi:chemotaxis protein MotB